MRKEERITITHYEAYHNYIKKSFLNNKENLNDSIENYAKKIGYPIRDLMDDGFFDKYLEFLYTKPVLDLLKIKLGPRFTESELKSLRAYLFHAYYFGKEEKIYKFQNNITRKIIDTDIQKVDGYFVRNPSKSVYLSFPYNSDIKIHNPLKGTYNVVGAYVFMDDIKSNIFIDKLYTPEDNARIVKILAIGGSPTNFEKQISFFSTIVVQEGVEVFTTIREHMKKYLITGQEASIPYIEGMFKFILNAILYINSSNPDINPVKAKYNHKARTIKEIAQNAPFSRINFTSVGDSIIIDRSFDNKNDSDTKSKYEISTLHWLVRPHWRMQPYGVGRKERKLIWIERYEKGSDLSATIQNKKYNVK